jgi:GNAT superfamily N-acetyltransferase
MVQDLTTVGIAALSQNRRWNYEQTDFSHGFVAYEGDKPASTARAIINQGCLFLFLVATMPEARRKGYGEAVVRHSLQAAPPSDGHQ